MTGVRAPDDPLDFFVSYAEVDLPWAEWIAWTLEKAGYRVLIQAWDFVSGANRVASLSNGIGRTSRTIAVLSDNYADYKLGPAEWQSAFLKDPAGHERRLLVVRVTDCHRPSVLEQIVSVDLFDEAEGSARDVLLTSVEVAVNGGRNKPASAPAFPLTKKPDFPGAARADSVAVKTKSWEHDLAELHRVRDYLHPDVWMEYQRFILSNRFGDSSEPVSGRGGDTK